MALLQNLVEGFAGAVGDQNTVNRIEKQKGDRVATQHEELAAQTQSILNDVAGLQQRRAALDPKSTTYQKDIAENDTALHQARQTLQDLYHPEKNPDALQHLGGFIRAHIGRQKGPPKTPAQIKESLSSRIANLDAAAAGPGTSAVADNPYEKEKKQLIAYGMSEEDADRAVRHKVGVEDKKPHVSDYAAGLRRFVQGEGGDPDNPTAAQEQAYRAQRHKDATGSTSKWSQEAAVYEKQWGKKLSEWSPEELSYFNQKLAYDSARSGSSTTTRLEKNAEGQIVPVEITSVHGPTRPPVDPHATPGSLKSRVPRPQGSSVKVGEPLPFQALTPDITKAKTVVSEATKLATIADEVAKKPNDATNVKGFAIALERARAGRFTSAALDKMLEAGWGNKLEQWANNPTTGTLPSDVLRQLVEGAHENVRGAQAGLDALLKKPSTASSGKAVSLAKAKLLPQNKGKSDDDIRKDIEAHGHTVTQ